MRYQGVRALKNVKNHGNTDCNKTSFLADLFFIFSAYIRAPKFIYGKLSVSLSYFGSKTCMKFFLCKMNFY